MDNEYSAYEPEEEKNKKFKITRGMIILAGVILVIIIALIIIIVVSNSNKPREITEADYHELEERMEDEVFNYVTDMSEEVTRVELSTMVEDGTLNEDDLPAIKVCDGYVNVYLKNGQEIDNAYISCEDGYKTKGYQESNGKDVTKPVIKLKGSKKMTITQGTKFVDPGATAKDDVDGDLTKEIIVSGRVDTSKIGTYTLTYTVIDSSDNKASVKRTVIVEEKETTTTETTTTTTTTTTTRYVGTTNRTTKGTTRGTTRRVTTTTRRATTRATTKRVTTPPTIKLKGDNPYTITQGYTYVDPGFTATDALGKNITSKVTKKGSVNTSVVKTYYITYSVKDDYGNSASTSRAVRVVAKSNVSSVTVTPNSLSLKVGKTYKLYASASYTGSAPTYVWKSSNASVATVSSDGTVTAKSAGTATITVTAGTKSNSCTVRVSK